MATFAKGVAVVASALTLFTLVCSAQMEDAVAPPSAPVSVPSQIQDVYGLSQQGDKFYIIHAGVKYEVYHDPDQQKVWFYNTETEQAAWADPRTLDGKVLTRSLSEEVATVDMVEEASGVTIFMVAMLPILLLGSALAGRLYYLHVYYPDLLWPTKERKYRARQNQKFKPQKARGKMSQDGKGGRSANS